MPQERVAIERPEGLRAVEPTMDEVRAAAPTLFGFYNEAHNRSMLAHEAEMSEDEIVQYYEEARDDGDRPFLLFHEGALVGDADFRSFDAESAEFAILIGARNLQGKGLGGRFTVLLHAFALRRLGLSRVYVTILPANQPSIKLFQRLGYEDDQSPRARSLIDHESDVTLSIGREAFEDRHRAEMDLAVIRVRTSTG
jgi:RimJ/RimL family protein N-acetyltransferase